MKKKTISPALENASTFDPAALTKRPLILVVNGNDDIRGLSAELLNCSGYEAHAAADGASAWHALRAFTYDLVITDREIPPLPRVKLPGKGWTIPLPVPVITTSAVSSATKSPRQSVCPAVSLLMPYTVEEFLGMVEETLHVNYKGKEQMAAVSQEKQPAQAPNDVKKSLHDIGKPISAQLKSPHRILVAEDDSDLRYVNSAALIAFGYHVDTAEDGAAAWEALQLKSYDLLITDNEMPKVTGVELLKKLHTARMALPVIMATGALPKDEFARQPWLHPAAVLIKPYTAEEFVGTVRDVLHAIAADSGRTGPPSLQNQSRQDVLDLL